MMNEERIDEIEERLAELEDLLRHCGWGEWDSGLRRSIERERDELCHERERLEEEDA